MARVSLATVDTAGGTITNSEGIGSTLAGRPLAVAPDAVVSHPPCPQVPVHCAAVMTAAARSTIAGRRLVVAGDAATCGHAASAAAQSTLD